MPVGLGAGRLALRHPAIRKRTSSLPNLHSADGRRIGGKRDPEAPAGRDRWRAIDHRDRATGGVFLSWRSVPRRDGHFPVNR